MVLALQAIISPWMTPARAEYRAVHEPSTKNSMTTTLKVPVYAWPRIHERPPKAVVIAVHSFLLDGSRYDALAHHLNERNIIVFALDVRGFGRWQASPVPKDRNPNYPASLKDLNRLAELIKTEYPNTPVICVGESMGSNLLVSFASREENHIDGLVLSSPCAIKKKAFIKPRALLDLVLTILMPWREIDLTTYFEQYTGKQDNVKINNSTRTSMSALDLIRTMRMLSKSLRNADSIPSDLPILIIQGESDRLCQKGKVKNLVAMISSDRKDFIVVPNGGHLFLESGNTQNMVAETVERWIQTQAKSLKK